MAVDLNYGIGVEGKNLVLKTLGRVYVKVKDRKYELAFRPEDIIDQIKQYGENSTASELTGNSNLVIAENSVELDTMEYPGDETLVITKDGQLYYTENNGYTPINIQYSGNELTLQNLYLSGQIIFTGNGIPMVIPNNNTIQNLNADLLDGYHSSSYAIKNQNEIINGNWNFTNQLTFNIGYGLRRLSDANNQKVWIDFTTGNIKCNTLTANEISLPSESIRPDLVSGIGNEVWVGSEINIMSFSDLTDFNESEISKFHLVSDAYDNYLPEFLSDEDNATRLALDDWYNLLFTTYDKDNETYTIKDFSDPTVIESVNAVLAPNYTVNDFMPLILALQDADLSNFTGNYYNIVIDQETDIQLLLPNMIIKDNRGNTGVVLDRYTTSVIVKMLNENTFLNGSKIVVIGNLNRSGGVVFKANDSSLSILKNPLDISSAVIYFGELSKVDNSKSGIGIILSGTYPTNIVQDNTLDTLRNYQHTSEINIENPYLKWGDNINIFNEDGSGYLSKGQIRWSSNNDLIVDRSDIINSRINNTIITNSSFQSGNILINANGSGNIGDKIQFDSTTVTLNSPLGPAGGDLEGNYPNPALAQTYKDRISALEAKIQELETRISALESN